MSFFLFLFLYKAITANGLKMGKRVMGKKGTKELKMY
jgi:hypothetical protein